MARRLLDDAEQPGAAEQRMAEHGRDFFPLMVRVTGATARQVPIPATGDGSALEDVAATSAAEAWAVRFTLAGPLVLHWNGTAWTRVQLPAAIGRGVLGVDGVAVTSATDAWAVMRTDSAADRALGRQAVGRRRHPLHRNGLQPQ